MKAHETDLAKIRQIRKYRTDSLRSQLARKDAEVRQAAKALEDNQQSHTELLLQQKEQEQEAWMALKQSKRVRVEQLHEFTCLQSTGSRERLQSQRGIDSANVKLDNTVHEQEKCHEAASLAEKRLVKIEEVIDKKIWK